MKINLSSNSLNHCNDNYIHECVIRQFYLINKHVHITKILVALSGGSDSVALLKIFHSVKALLNIEIYAYHLNHNLRGAESDKDEQFCCELANSLNIKFYSYKLNSAEILKSSEAVLRKIRYQKLLELASELGINVILTGHTKDDDIETILFNMFRGTKIKGICGIKTLNKLQQNFFLYRPLLEFSKIELIDYLKQNNQDYRVDSSNFKSNYTRNYIRTQILPAIKERFPKYDYHIRNLKKYLIQQNSIVENEFKKILKIIKLQKIDSSIVINKKNLFMSLSNFFAKNIIYYCLKYLKIEPNESRVNDLLKFIRNSNSTKLNIGDNKYLLVSKNSICFIKNINYNLNQFLPINLKIGDNFIPWLKKIITITKIKNFSEIDFLYNNNNCVYVNLPDNFDISIRLLKSNDVFYPFGFNKNTSAKKYIHTHKKNSNSKLFNNPLNSFYCSYNLNKPIWYVVANKDEVLWIPGIGVSQKIKFSDKPSYKISIH